MSKYKCIIFDCDGVLVDSEALSNQILVDLANRYGAQIDLDYAMKHFKGSFFYACKERISQLTDRDLPETFEAEYREKCFEVFAEKMTPIEGVMGVLENMELPFCVASSGPENKIRFNLERTGLLPFFKDAIFSCYTIQKWKPDPAVFLWAAETMGFAPEECLVVEDSLLGVRAAKAGGFDVFGFTAHDYNNELQQEATQTFESMDKLLSML